jgi:hypothetical protein
MTRRGSLVYYFSAWVLGCFFMCTLIWIKWMYPVKLEHPVADFAFGLLSLYFLGLASGALTSLLVAFLLRRAMLALKCKTPSHWAVAGAIMTPIVIAVVGIWGLHITMQRRSGMGFLEMLTYGPKAVLDAGWWLAIPAGAATAFFLCRIERAFAPEKTAVNA